MELEMANETVAESIWDFKGKQDFVDQWLLMSSPVPIALVTMSYLIFVLKMGPQFMTKRQPFQLNSILMVYNTAQVFVSLYIFCYGVRLLWPLGLIYKICHLNRENAEDLSTGMYYYFIAKLSELLDTIFFVLRKKNDQVTFLHVYHHSLMLLVTWLTLKYEPTYTPLFLGTINSFVHVIMYAYYGLSAIPHMSKYLWWKKYITSMQLIQFMAIIVQVALNNLYSGCPPSYTLLYVIIINAILFVYLFGDFYFKSYSKKVKPTTNTNLNGKENEKVVQFADGILNGTCHEKVQ